MIYSCMFVQCFALFLVAATIVTATFNQTEPLRVNKDVRVVGLTFESAKDSKPVKIRAPKDAEPGDILIIYIAGSASGKKIPSDPGKEWEDIIDIGKEDLNLKAFWKPYELSDAFEELTFDEDDYPSLNSADEDLKISDGKNTFVSIVALRGIDGRKPIVDADADEDTDDGREGDAKAPSVRAEKGGAVLACFIYDDPHVATVRDDDFEMLLSTDPGGDGIALAIASTDSNGDTGSIRAQGRREEKGGGDDIAMTISLRAGDPVAIPTDSPSSKPTRAPSPPPTGAPSLPATGAPIPSPTGAPSSLATGVQSPPPTGDPKNTCNTDGEISCRDMCYVAKKCGSDRRSSCHTLCRFECCEDSSQKDRSCFTSEEKICRESCFSENCFSGEDVDVRQCKVACRDQCCHEDA